MTGFLGDIETLSKTNAAFRHVLYTGPHLQLVLMALKPGEDIGMEAHSTHDQFFRIEKGCGEVVIDGVKRKVEDGHAIIVPAGSVHNLTNTGETPLHLYTLYAPPNHIDKLVQSNKSDAEASHEAFDGVTTEAAV